MSKVAKVWNLSNGECLQTFGIDRSLAGIAFNPNDHRVVIVDSGGHLMIWNPLTGREILKLTWLNGRLLDVAFTPDGNRIVATCEDGTLLI